MANSTTTTLREILDITGIDSYEDYREQRERLVLADAENHAFDELDTLWEISRRAMMALGVSIYRGDRQ